MKNTSAKIQSIKHSVIQVEDIHILLGNNLLILIMQIYGKKGEVILILEPFIEFVNC